MQTPATAFLQAHGIGFTEHSYDYVEHGGTAVSAESLGVPEHEVVKTLVMQDERALPLLVLMHGDRKVSTKNLARQAGCKSIEPCRPDVAQRHTGYQVGGTSPFGTRKPLPVFMGKSSSRRSSIRRRRSLNSFLANFAQDQISRPVKEGPASYP